MLNFNLQMMIFVDGSGWSFEVMDEDVLGRRLKIRERK